MKKFLAGLMTFFVFAITIPVSVSASSGENRSGNLTYGSSYTNFQRNRSYRRYQRQSNRRYYANNGRYNRRYYSNNGRYNNRYYSSGSNYRYGRDRRSVYSRHRNLINIGIGGASGAVIGGLIGGRRGALIGAGVGAGAGAAYTYGIKPKRKRSRYARRY